MFELLESPEMIELFRMCIYAALVGVDLSNPTRICLEYAENMQDIFDLMHCEATADLCKMFGEAMRGYGSEIASYRVEAYCMCCSKDKPILKATLHNVEKWRAWTWATYVLLTHIRNRHKYGKCGIAIVVVKTDQK